MSATVIKQPCETCAGMGYLDDGRGCFDCDGHGTVTFELVSCPVHGQAVAVAADGTLHGTCQGCVQEAARAIQIIAKTTGDGRSFLAEECAPVARGGAV